METTVETPQNLVPLGLSEDQAEVFQALKGSKDSIFLTGPAGCGKSHVIREWRDSTNTDEFPVLASTGTAAVLIGGRTFHGFFGLGILEGGPQAVLERALKDRRLKKRLKEVKGVLIDEVSMISSEAFGLADLIARHAREEDIPWGGLRVIAVGDFAQLPPVSRFGQKRDWCFLGETWEQSQFKTMKLSINHRVNDLKFLKLLESIREGDLNREVRDFLNSKCVELETEEFMSAPKLFPRRDQVDAYNLKELNALPGAVKSYPSIFISAEQTGNRAREQWLETLRKNMPVKDVLDLKVGCRVLFVQNDPQKRWVNGTRGVVRELRDEQIIVEKESGRTVKVERVSFSMMNADGEVLATLLSFPLALAYAVTIHKSQGMTLTALCTDLRRLWEPGQAYVALSRLRDSSGLFISGWSPSSFIIDPEVVRFYKMQSGGTDAPIFSGQIHNSRA